MLRKYLLLILLAYANTVTAQTEKKDSLHKVVQQEEVTITATRTERKLGNVAVPVTIINQKTIKHSGSVRLQDILGEQTGLFVTSNFGNGIQMQGLSADYTLILLNGGPLVGRNGGVLDLSRITIANIKKIEIVKGPSSSLYGSEALAGVINIITEEPTSTKWGATLRYGRFNATDATFFGSAKWKKIALNASVNRNSTDGYDFNPNTVGKTQEAFSNYTGQLQVLWNIAAKSKLTYNNRIFTENQNGNSLLGTEKTKIDASLIEFTHNLTLQHFFTNNIKSQLRLYSTQYKAAQTEKVENSNLTFYNDYFKQNFYRVENQTDINIAKENKLTLGVGTALERLNTNRYSGIKKNTIYYAFMQNDWMLTSKINLISGIRYDANQTYQNKWSPKIAAQYKWNKNWKINASYGAGFKAPDYRQQFLNFTNNVAGGYTVYGANEISYNALLQQKQLGQIQDLTSYATQLKILLPEVSNAINVGLQWSAQQRWNAKLNIFRNDLQNQIVTQTIAFRTGSLAPIFSYFNVNKSFTNGAEIDIQYKWNKYFSLQAGYQYLRSGDKQVWQDLKEGKLFGKPLGSLSSVQLNRKDYAGLVNTSRSIANLKFFYENDKKVFANLRAIYRSRFGVTDVDGNKIINRKDEYANGFVQINMSAGKTFSNGIALQLGIDNVTNYRNEKWLTNLPGINYYTTLSYNFNKIKQIKE